MPSIEIPISFEYEGIQFDGYFCQPLGGGKSWHLDLNRYHYGQLVKYSTGWAWCPNINNWFPEPYMEQFFIETVENYLKGADRAGG